MMVGLLIPAAFLLIFYPSSIYQLSRNLEWKLQSKDHEQKTWVTRKLQRLMNYNIRKNRKKQDEDSDVCRTYGLCRHTNLLFPQVFTVTIHYSKCFFFPCGGWSTTFSSTPWTQGFPWTHLPFCWQNFPWISVDWRICVSKANTPIANTWSLTLGSESSGAMDGFPVPTAQLSWRERGFLMGFSWREGLWVKRLGCIWNTSTRIFNEYGRIE